MAKYKKYYYHIAVFLILLTAVIFRFYNYYDRWGLAYDQAHDALVARGAINLHKIPLLGPFSSAGPFQTGGEWYWIIILGTVLKQEIVILPWVFITILGIIFIYLLIRMNSEFFGKKIGITAGLLAAVSSAQIDQTLNLTNQTPQAIVSLGVIWCALRYLKTESIHALFWLGFFISLAISIHLQGALLFSLLLSLVLVGKLRSLKKIFVILVGLSIPLLPIYFYDVQFGFPNIKNMMFYYMHDQYRISFEVLNRRWLTYILNFLPNEWTFISGGHYYIYFLLIFCGVVILVSDVRRKILTNYLVFIILSLILMTVMVRYTRTPIFSSYLVSVHPLIFIINSWIVVRVMERLKYAGYILLAVIIGFHTVNNINKIRISENQSIKNSERYYSKINSLFMKSNKYSFYDCSYDTALFSLPVVLLFEAEKMISEDGVKIGFGKEKCMSSYPWPVYIDKSLPVPIMDLSSMSEQELLRYGWKPVNTNNIYRDTEDWRMYSD